MPVNTASSASDKSEIKKIIPTHNVDSPAITAMILSLRTMKASTVQIIPETKARYRGILYTMCGLLAARKTVYVWCNNFSLPDSINHWKKRPNIMECETKNPAKTPVNIVVEHQNTQNSLRRVFLFISSSCLSIK